ncbi:MAG: A/G-specific adenine glycosylase [bacterium]
MGTDISKFRRDLLRWYAASKRDLPWRRTRDPYAILVSELMLQQTQVKTALPYYEKFLRHFPNPEALASASENAVLASWAGLGYYRRARFLRAAAQAIVARGSFPEHLEGIRALPGVGAYTAAAVGSIAFGLQQAVVDGNVIRVLARLAALGADPTCGEGAKKVRDLAQNLLDLKRPGDFNQALMELGATVCVPDKPRCHDCPVQGHCAGFLEGKPGDYPRLPPRAATQVLVKAVVLALRGSGPRSEILTRARSSRQEAKFGASKTRLEGFWAFPEFEVPSLDFSAAEVRAVKEIRRLVGSEAPLTGRLPRVRHRITVYDIHLLPLRFFVPKSASLAPAAIKQGWQWVGLSKLADLPLASAEKKLLTLLNRVLVPNEGRGSQLGLIL